MQDRHKRYRERLREAGTLGEYYKRHNRTSKARSHRFWFGEYVKLIYCEECGETEAQLLCHHKYYATCTECAPNSKSRRGTCKILTHIQTLCRTCHRKVHNQIDYRTYQNFRDANSHLDSINGEVRGNSNA